MNNAGDDCDLEYGGYDDDYYGDDDYGSCENCGCNLYDDDFGDLCDQCAWWMYGADEEDGE